MFIPKIYKSEDKALMKKIIGENGFALLISDKEKLTATHSMFLLNEADDNFYLGAHSYISSSWYEKTNVSTWNYEAVQIRGKVKLMNDEELYRHLEKLTFKYEKTQKCPMFVENMGEDLVRKEMKGAFGINIIPTEIFIANKLSQNRNDKDFKNIITELTQSGCENSKKIAEKMAKIKIGM